jgi:hypothetical protein
VVVVVAVVVVMLGHASRSSTMLPSKHTTRGLLLEMQPASKSTDKTMIDDFTIPLNHRIHGIIIPDGKSPQSVGLPCVVVVFFLVVVVFESVVVVFHKVVVVVVRNVVVVLIDVVVVVLTDVVVVLIDVVVVVVVVSLPKSTVGSA